MIIKKTILIIEGKGEGWQEKILLELVLFQGGPPMNRREFFEELWNHFLQKTKALLEALQKFLQK